MGARTSAESKQATRDARNAKRRDAAATAKAADNGSGPAPSILPSTGGVDVASLEIGQHFMLDACEFMVKTIEGDHITAAYMEWGPAGGYKVERWGRSVVFGTSVEPV